MSQQKLQTRTDPTRSLTTWLEVSETVANKIDQLSMSSIYTLDELDARLLLIEDEIWELYYLFTFLMMEKGIFFATEHMNRLSPQYHLAVTWTPADNALREDLLRGCREYLTAWIGTIRTEASGEILEGTLKGESIDQIASRVSAVIKANKNRGVLIARTELMRAWNAAAHSRYQQAGFDEVWMTARDPVVCDICEPLDGVPIKEIGAIPPAHPNCRCGILPKLL